MTFRKAVSAPVGEPLPDWAKALLSMIDEPQTSGGDEAKASDTAHAAKSVPVPRGSDN